MSSPPTSADGGDAQDPNHPNNIGDTAAAAVTQTGLDEETSPSKADAGLSNSPHSTPVPTKYINLEIVESPYSQDEQPSNNDVASRELGASNDSPVDRTSQEQSIQLTQGETNGLLSLFNAPTADLQVAPESPKESPKSTEEAQEFKEAPQDHVSSPVENSSPPRG